MSHGRLRRAISDAGSLFVLPITAALLPWRFGFALLKWVSRREHVWASQLDSAWQQARIHFPQLDETEFKQRQRLLMLVDRCDSYLTWLHGAAWWARQVDIEGEWPQNKSGSVCLTAHWGAGHWVWRLLASHGVRAHFLARRGEVADAGRGRLALLYTRWRVWALPRIGCCGPIYTGGGGARVLAALAAGESVVGMLDVPSAAQQRSVQVSLLGQPARLRLGLAALAERSQAPVMIFTCGLDFNSGRRKLVLQSLPAGTSAENMVKAYAAHLQSRLQEQPAAWSMWPQAAHFWPHQT